MTDHQVCMSVQFQVNLCTEENDIVADKVMITIS